MKISINLFDPNSISKAIKDLKAYQRQLLNKSKRLINIMTKAGERAAKKFIAHHDYTGTTEHSIMGYREDNHGIIIAGGAAIWLEFGTGVKKNSASNTQIPGIVPHGTYGHGKGSNPNGWYFKLPESEAQDYVSHYGGQIFYTQDGNAIVHTNGVEATYFMYNTAMFLRTNLSTFARRAYGNK